MRSLVALRAVVIVNVDPLKWNSSVENEVPKLGTISTSNHYQIRVSDDTLLIGSTDIKGTTKAYM